METPGGVGRRTLMEHLAALLALLAPQAVVQVGHVEAQSQGLP